MTTYVQLQDKVSRVLQDPDREIFTLPIVKDMITAAWAEINLTAPERFIEEFEPANDQYDYQLRASVFSTPNDDIRPVAVEIWTVSPKKPIKLIEPASSHPFGLSYSEAGWRFWGGYISLPYRWVQFVKDHDEDYLIRVRGYSPWKTLSADGDVVPFSDGVTEALVVFCNIEALKRLVNDRALFMQWQTQTNNTDVTPAALAGDLERERAEWRRLSRAIRVLTEAP